MYLVIILREVVAPTGAALVPVLQHMDLTCHKPKHCGKQDRAGAAALSGFDSSARNASARASCLALSPR